jgi:hypothetical protein
MDGLGIRAGRGWERQEDAVEKKEPDKTLSCGTTVFCLYLNFHCKPPSWCWLKVNRAWETVFPNFITPDFIK